MNYSTSNSLASVAAIIVLVGLAFNCSVIYAQDVEVKWSGFQNGGVFADQDMELPLEWSVDSNVKWQVDLEGYGQSTPVVFKDQAYVTSVAGENKESIHVRAINLETGDTVWNYEKENSTPEANNIYVSRAAVTPVVDSDGVIAFFEGGNMVALDHEGKLRWEKDFIKEYGDVKTRHSLASSLEQSDSHVFVWVERQTEPYIVALDKKSGQETWSSEGVGSTSWASPRLISVGDQQHLVLSASGKIVGIDPSNGERLWSFDEIGGNSTPTPIPVGDSKFLIGASPGRGGDGGTTTARSNGLIEIKSTDQGYQAEWVWQAERATSSFGSPVACAGRAYFVNRQGVVYCLNLETGKELFAKRSESGSVWATPLANANHVFLFGKDGATTVLTSSDQWEVASLNKLWQEKSESEQGTEGGRGNFGGPVLYAATPLSKSILIRRGDALFRVGQ